MSGRRRSNGSVTEDDMGFEWGKRTVFDHNTGETYVTWGPDNSRRARNLRKSIFK